jgi:cytochrome c-type biogenesis protein CcmE
MEQPPATVRPSSSKRRAKFMAGGGIVGLVLIALVGSAMTRPDATSFYLTASELVQKGPTPAGQDTRVNGQVVDGSLQRDGLESTFVITDGDATVTVTTDRPLPSAFKGGADVVAHGAFDGTVFTADEVLAKCPSKFQPATS